MRLLFLHAGAELYGADRILLELVDGMVKHGHVASVVLPSDGPLVGALRQAGAEVRIHSLGVLRRKYFSLPGLFNRFVRIVSATFFVGGIIRREAIDIVHSNTSAVLVGAIASRLTRRKHVWHIHEITTKPQMVRRLFSWLIPRGADRVVCVSEAVRRHLIAGDRLNEFKAIVIHNGIEARQGASGGRARVRQELGLAGDDVLIGMIGRVNHWKGQHALVDAARLVAQSKPNARFLLVGGTFAGEEQLLINLRQRVVDEGLSERVTVWDFRSDIADILAALDVFVLPSIEPDPFPTVVLEAMHAGVPIVAFAHGGVQEMVEKDRTGYLVPPCDVIGMAEAISKLIEMGLARKSFGDAGQRRVAMLFTKKRFVEDFASLYESLGVLRGNP